MSKMVYITIYDTVPKRWYNSILLMVHICPESDIFEKWFGWIRTKLIAVLYKRWYINILVVMSYMVYITKSVFPNRVKNGAEHHMVHITISEVKNGVYHQTRSQKWCISPQMTLPLIKHKRTNKRTSLLWGREVGLLFFRLGWFYYLINFVKLSLT